PPAPPSTGSRRTARPPCCRRASANDGGATPSGTSRSSGRHRRHAPPVPGSSRSPLAPGVALGVVGVVDLERVGLADAVRAHVALRVLDLVVAGAAPGVALAVLDLVVLDEAGAPARQLVGSVAEVAHVGIPSVVIAVRSVMDRSSQVGGGPTVGGDTLAV